MSIDARKSFDSLLRSWGHDVLLQRSTLTHSNKGSKGGFEDRLERHTVRHMYPANRGLPQIMQERQEGVTSVADMIYYFRWDVRPKEGDRIYEEDDRYAGSKKAPGVSTWIIDFALPMRGANGEIEYWAVGVSREEPN